MNRKKFQKRLTKIRIENNLSQEEFAKSIGVSLYRYQKWEQGLSLPKLKEFVFMCNLYNIDMNYLLDLTPKLNKEKYDEKQISKTDN